MGQLAFDPDAAAGVNPCNSAFAISKWNTIARVLSNFHSQQQSRSASRNMCATQMLVFRQIKLGALHAKLGALHALCSATSAHAGMHKERFQTNDKKRPVANEI
ncbi:MAG: hypothetical protein NTU86_09430 [Burkholderiales bacterium]|nr:hypothetical protein [Burkholderiales bacterium]